MKHVFILLMLFLDNVEFALTETECSELPTLERAFVSDEYRKAEYHRGDVIYYSCDLGFTTGLNTSYICTEDGWRALTIGHCIEDTFPVRLGCTPPPPLKNGYALRKLAYFYADGQRVQFKCDQPHMMKGVPYKTCTNGQWTGNLYCEVVDCGDPEPLLNGGVSFLSDEPTQYGSVVQYYCNEPYYSLSGAVNVSFRCEADRQWRAVSDVDVRPTCLPVCGKPTVGLFSIQRIIGGSAAPQGSIPWQVRLKIPAGSGGGMIIADRWVLTSAHVLSQRETIQNSDVKIQTSSMDDFSHMIADSIHKHPGYNNPDQLTFVHDIALIKLPEPITFNQLEMPICLPSEEHTLQEGILGVVSGFGLKIDDDGGYNYSKNLTYVRLPVVNPRQCNESLNLLRKTHPQPFPTDTRNMFCAGYPGGGTDACAGDGGGPFALWRKDHYWAAGIVSWGVECAKAGRYGFYTEVSKYVDWIHKTMNKN